MGPLGWAAAAPKPHAGSSDGVSDRTFERIRHLVGSRRVVWEAKRDEKLNWVCDGLDSF